MAAPKKNQFWKLRTKHGRSKIFGDAKVLATECMQYFEITAERHWDKKEFHGKDAKECTINMPVPFTLEGLCVYLDISKQTWNNYRNEYKERSNKDDKDKIAKGFIDLIARIEQIIYVQKFEGATVGAFNPNIIAQELGLKNQIDITSDGQQVGQTQIEKIEIYTNQSNEEN